MLAMHVHGCTHAHIRVCTHTHTAAMEQFKKGMLSDGDASESLAAAESAFVREAGASVPSKTSCTFTWALQLTQRLSDPYQLPPQLVDEVESERLALKGRVEGLALLRIPTLRIPTCPSPPCASPPARPHPAQGPSSWSARASWVPCRPS